MVSGTQPASIVDLKSGVVQFLRFTNIESVFANITNPELVSPFGETFAKSLEAAVKESQLLGPLLASASLSNGDFVTSTNHEDRGEAKGMEYIAKLIKLRGQAALGGPERDGFIAQISAYDTHFLPRIDEKLKAFDTALSQLVSELKSEGVWDRCVCIYYCYRVRLWTRAAG